MQLAFCLFHYFPYGGLQRECLALAKACQAQGAQIHVITTHWQGEIPPEFQLHLVAKKGHRNHTQMQHYAQAVAQVTKKNHFDSVIGFNKISGLDVYFAADNCAAEKYAHTLKRFIPGSRARTYIQLEKAVFNGQTQILFLNEQQASIYQKHYGKAYPYRTLPVHIDPQFQHPTTQTRRQDKYCLLFIATAPYVKGLDRVLLALQALPDTLKKQCELKVVGSDPAMLKWPVFMPHTKNLHIECLGSRSDIPVLMQQAHLLLHPARQEAGGLVLIEAAASGLPVITSAECGYAEILKETQTGIVLPLPFQQEAFNQALLQSLNNPQQWQTMHNHGLAYGQDPHLYQQHQQTAQWLCQR